MMKAIVAQSTAGQKEGTKKCIYFLNILRVEVKDDECYPLEYMENTTLTTFVAKKLREGTKADELKQQLLLVGWSEEEALQAVALGLMESGVPSPERIIGGQGRLASTVEVILNLFSFILLGGVATALMVLYYQIINHYFPDALAGGYGYSDVSSSTIHYAIAATTPQSKCGSNGIVRMMQKQNQS